MGDELNYGDVRTLQPRALFLQSGHDRPSIMQGELRGGPGLRLVAGDLHLEGVVVGLTGLCPSGIEAPSNISSFRYGILTVVSFPQSLSTRTSMAETREINKSEEIRKVGAELKANGQKISPKAIMDILAKKGIEVSSPQCSTVLKNAGFKRRTRRSGEAGTKATPAKGASEKAVRKSDAVTIDEVIAAKKAAEQFGGADRLLAAVKALERLS